MVRPKTGGGPKSRTGWLPAHSLEQAPLPLGITTPAGAHRAQGNTAVEVRFADQYYRQTAPRPPGS
jgi:hypothetical protein